MLGLGKKKAKKTTTQEVPRPPEPPKEEDNIKAETITAEAVVEDVPEVAEEKVAQTPEPQQEEPIEEALEEARVLDAVTTETINSFNKEYDGLVPHGTDTVRANLQFAIFAEAKKTNLLLAELISLAKEE